MIAAVVLVLPTINPALWPHRTINLGLDLQGGMHLVLEVETQKAVQAQISRFANDLKEVKREKRIRHTDIAVKGTQLKITARGQQNIESLNAILEDNNYKKLERVSENREGNKLIKTLGFSKKEADDIQKMATEQALETIRNRINEFGVSEPSIRI